jgi:hypothetical protein
MARQPREWFQIAPFQSVSERSLNVSPGPENMGFEERNVLELRRGHPVANPGPDMQKYIRSGAKHKTDIP